MNQSGLCGVAVCIPKKTNDIHKFRPFADKSMQLTVFYILSVLQTKNLDSYCYFR